MQYAPIKSTLGGANLDDLAILTQDIDHLEHTLFQQRGLKLILRK